MFRAALMGKIMSKTREMSETNETSRPATLEDHCPLADSELDAVSGGDASKNEMFRGRYQLRLDEARDLLAAQP
jgi:hypothetical protein